MMKVLEIPLIYERSGLDEYSAPDGEMVMPDDAVDDRATFTPGDYSQGVVESGAVLNHSGDDGDIWLFVSGGALWWSPDPDGARTPVVMTDDPLGDVYGGTQVGEFVVLTTSLGFRWLRRTGGDSGFLDLGGRLPEPDLSFGVRQESVSSFSPLGVGWPSATLLINLESADVERMHTLLSGGNGRLKGAFGQGTLSEINGEVNGTLRGFINAVADRRLFLGPMRVVTALRLFDGSHTGWSDPVRIDPNGGDDGLAGGMVITAWNIEGTLLRCAVEIRSLPVSLALGVRSADRLTLWRGVVTGVDIFLTPEAEIWDPDREVTGLTWIGHERAWNVWRAEAENVRRQLEEKGDWHLFASIPVDDLIAAAGEGEGISLSGCVTAAGCTEPDFGWRSALEPVGVGRVSGSAVAWGRARSGFPDGARVWRVELSRRANPFVWPSSARHVPDAGEILGVAPAVRSLSSGQLGEFPAYLFTSEGVWAMRAGDGGELVAVQAVTLHRAISPGSILATSEGVFFCSERGLLLLKGTVVSVVTDSDGERVPDAGFLRGCHIWEDYAGGRLFLWDAQGEAFCYSFTASEWLSPASDVEVSRIKEESGVLSTRTLKLGGVSRRRRIVSVDVVAGGEWRDGEGVALYGADIPGVWHLLADVAGRRMSSLTGSPWRFHKVAMRGFASAPVALVISVRQ